MQKRRNWSVKQRFCGFMAFMVMFIYVFNHTSISLFFAASSGGTGTPSDAVRESGITLRNCPEEEVELLVMSDCTGYEAGDFVCLDVYIKNNSGEMITDGELRYRAKGIREETAYFEDPDGDYEGEAPDRMTGLRIGPGESRHVTFCFDIDEEIDKTKNQKVDFAFSWEKEGRTAKAKRTFCYVAGGMNLLLPEIHNQDGDDPEGRTWFWAGEPGQMTLHFDLGKILEIIEDKLENEDVIASSSDADIASGSDADIASGSDADKDYDSDMDVAGGSNAVTASGSDAQKDKVHGSGAVIASSSNAWVKWEGDSVLGGEKPVLKELSCKVETYGLQLDQFHVDERMTNADYSTGTRCSFKISRDAKLGIYYGTVTATYEMKGREYTSTQGFAIQVGEGEDQEVVRVIRLIDELPEPEEIEEILTGFEEAGDEAGYEAYYAGLYEQVMYVYYEYQALTQEQKEKVYNRDKLLAFEWLWGAVMALEEGSWEWLVEEIKKGGTQTITLTKDIEKPADAELPVTIPGGADITLDLNGKTLSCTSSDSSKNMFEVEASGQFTITDHSLSSAPETTAAERYGDWNEAKAAIENMSHYDPDTKTATYGVISRVSREDQSIRLDRHQVDMSKVGAIEGTDVDNIINVKPEGKLFIKGGRLTSLGKSKRLFVV